MCLQRISYYVVDCRAAARVRHTDGLGDELVENVFLVVFGNGGNDGGQRRDVGKLVLLGQLVAQGVEVDVATRTTILAGLVVLDQGIGDVGAATKIALALGGQVGAFLLGCGGGRYRDCSGRHDGFVRRVWRVKCCWLDDHFLNLFFAVTDLLVMAGCVGQPWTSYAGCLRKQCAL